MEKEKVQCEVQKHRPIKDKYGILSALKARKLLHYYNLVPCKYQELNKCCWQLVRTFSKKINAKKLEGDI